MDLKPGTIIGSYKIVRLVGSGGFAYVYEAIHTTLPDWKVAIKELHELYNVGPDIVDRFKQEANILRDFKNDSIPAVYDYIVLKGNHYMVMEWIDSETWDFAIYQRSSPILQNELISIGLGVLNALIYIHGNNSHGRKIIHRDIKPSNILLKWGKQQVRSWLLDFGISRVLNQPGKRSIVGTQHYASPQQLNGEPPDETDDIFSLGASLFESCGPTGRQPRERMLPAVFDSVTGSIYVEQTLRQYEQLGYDRPFLDIIVKALAYKRNDRFSSAEEMKKALMQLVNPIGPDHSRLILPSSKPQPSPPGSFVIQGDATKTDIGVVSRGGGWNPLKKPPTTPKS